MGFVDYISRNPDKEAKTVFKYDEEFVVAQIDVICKAVEFLQNKNFTIIKHGARPRKVISSTNASSRNNNAKEHKRGRGRGRKTNSQTNHVNNKNLKTKHN